MNAATLTVMVAPIAAGAAGLLLVWWLGRGSDLVDELLDTQGELHRRREPPTDEPLRWGYGAVRFVWHGMAASCDRAAPGAVSAPVSGAAVSRPPADGRR